MASGKTHDVLAYLILLPLFGIALFTLELGIYLALLVTIGAWFGGIYLSPDLDTRSRPFYRWGLFRFIWWPYQWMVTHRSSLSHGLVIAPVFRLVYFSAILILAWFAYKLFVVGIGDIQSVRMEVSRFLARHGRDFLYLGIGVWIGCLCHVAADVVTSRLPFRIGRR